MHSSIILAHTLSCASTSCDEWVTISGGTAPKIAMRYVSRYLSHDAIPYRDTYLAGQSGFFLRHLAKESKGSADGL